MNSNAGVWVKAELFEDIFHFLSAMKLCPKVWNEMNKEQWEKIFYDGVLPIYNRLDEQPIPVNQDEKSARWAINDIDLLIDDANFGDRETIKRIKEVLKKYWGNPEAWEELKSSPSPTPVQIDLIKKAFFGTLGVEAEPFRNNYTWEEFMKENNLDEATPVQEGADYWKKLYTECEEILIALCQLKAYKDSVGKDSLYQKMQPDTWKRANDFLNTNPQTGKKYFENLSPEKFNKHFSQEGLREDENKKWREEGESNSL